MATTESDFWNEQVQRAAADPVVVRGLSTVVLSSGDRDVVDMTKLNEYMHVQYGLMPHDIRAAHEICEAELVRAL